MVGHMMVRQMMVRQIKVRQMRVGQRVVGQMMVGQMMVWQMICWRNDGRTNYSRTNYGRTNYDRTAFQSLIQLWYNISDHFWTIRILIGMGRILSGSAGLRQDVPDKLGRISDLSGIGTYLIVTLRTFWLGLNLHKR